MAKLTKADAARQMGISRTTLYKLIDTGKLSVHPDGSIDSAELVRAVSTLSGTTVHRGRPAGVHIEQGEVDIVPQDYEHDGRAQWTRIERSEGWTDERQLTSTQALVDTLREQLQVALERERVYQARITWLEHHVDQMQHRYDRLLEAPRLSTPARASRLVPAGDAPGHAARTTPIPETWQQVLRYMQAHPGPQRPQDVQRALGRTQSARHVMHRMCTAGLLHRVSSGVYVLADTAKEEGEA